MSDIDYSKPIIGIDLGSTNSCACVVIDNGPEVIPTRSGNQLTSSAVTFNDDGTVSVGDEALAHRALGEATTVTGAKRLLGVSKALAEKSNSGIKENALAGKDSEETEISLGNGHVVLPEQASAAILASVRADAEEYLGVPVTDAVITVPAQFNDLRRMAVIDAAEIAGLNAVRLINEPTAAAVEYAWERLKRIDRNNDAGTQILVFDMGGGTIDVSLCRIDGNRIDTMATAGDGNLGGIDFDRVIADIVRHRIKSKYGVDVSKDGEASRRLLLEARNCKEELTDSMTADVSLPYAMRDKNGVWINIDETITREEFEKKSAPLVERALSLVDDTLKRVPSYRCRVSIDDVVLVGGSCKMPMIINAVADAAGVKPFGGIDKDLCVAQGAALVADAIRHTNVPGNVMKLRDITGMDYGQELYDNNGNAEIVTYIPAGTSIPCDMTMNTSNASTDDGMAIVYQAQHLTSNPKDPNNVKIFEHRFTFPHAPKFSKNFVDIMSIDENGIMTVETRDGGITGPALMSEKINLQQGADVKKRLAEAKSEGILLRR